MEMKTTNAKGQPLTCKFCHKQVWYDDGKQSYYEVGGKVLHVENCERRREFYKNEAYARAEAQRQKRR